MLGQTFTGTATPTFTSTASRITVERVHLSKFRGRVDIEPISDMANIVRFAGFFFQSIFIGNLVHTQVWLQVMWVIQNFTHKGFKNNLHLFPNTLLRLYSCGCPASKTFVETCLPMKLLVRMIWCKKASETNIKCLWLASFHKRFGGRVVYMDINALTCSEINASYV